MVAALVRADGRKIIASVKGWDPEAHGTHAEMAKVSPMVIGSEMPTEGETLEARTTGAVEQKKGQEEFKDCGMPCLFVMALGSLKKENNEQKFEFSSRDRLKCRNVL